MACFLMFECQHPHRNRLVHIEPRDRMLTRHIAVHSMGAADMLIRVLSEHNAGILNGLETRPTWR